MRRFTRVSSCDHLPDDDDFICMAANRLMKFADGEQDVEYK